MNLTYFGIFLEGLLSFFSPCVLPLLPVYMAYLSGGTETNEEGERIYPRKAVFLNTLFFVLGICFAFFVFAVSVASIRTFIDDYKEVIGIIGGTLIILFGLHECGLINISLLNREFSLKDKLNLKGMNIFKAFLFGFLFSFAWSPCIGPLLANALLLAGSESGGWLYLLFFALGLVIPFLISGLFTSAVLGFLEKKKNLFRYVLIIAGILLIGFGSYMIYTNARDIQHYKHPAETETEDEDPMKVTAKVFYDQNGGPVSLRDYEGKYIYLNFVASWCTYCREEIPYYLDFAKRDDVVCFYVMSPMVSREGDKDSIISYVSGNRMGELPVLIDEEGTLLYRLGISAFPTVYVISPDGQYLGYASGMNDLEGFEAIHEKAVEAYEGAE